MYSFRLVYYKGNSVQKCLQLLEDRDRHHYKLLVSRLMEEGWELWQRNDGIVPYTYEELCHLVLHRDSMVRIGFEKGS